MRRVLACTAGIGFIVLGAIIRGEDGIASDEPPLVSVTVSTPQTTYLLGEPIPIDLVVRNILTLAIHGLHTPDLYVLVRVGHAGQATHPIDQAGEMYKVAMHPATLKPGETWTYLLRAIQDYNTTPRGQAVPNLAFPAPGAYAIEVGFPLFSAAPEGQKASLPARTYNSNRIQVQVLAPQRDDAAVQQVIQGEDFRYFLWTDQLRNGDTSTVPRALRLLVDYPGTGYRAALQRSLRGYYRRTLQTRSPDDPEREAVRAAAGEPDDRLFGEDRRLDAVVSLDYPEPTPVGVVFAEVQGRTGVLLEASPFYGTTFSRASIRQKMTVRDMMARIGSTGIAAWSRRGDGYYLYEETLDSTLEKRTFIGELLGPPPPAFPEDKRLDVRVAATTKQPTPIDQVVSSYAKQSGVPLTAAPFFSRCQQSGVSPGLVLREEMGFLARTFRAEWRRRGDGYYLDAGAEADRADPPPAKAGLLTGGAWWPATLAGLVVAGLGGLTFWRRSRAREAAHTASDVRHLASQPPREASARP